MLVAIASPSAAMSESSLDSSLATFVASLPVDGGSITVISRGDLASTVASSDPVASRLDAIQTDLGEGPRFGVCDSGVPVVVADMAEGTSRWPLFTAAAVDVPVGAVAAFPLLIGFHLVGVVDLYSATSTGLWSGQAIADAGRSAARLARPAVRLAARSAAADEPTSGAAELRREVHQAVGMLIVAADLRPDEALARMEAYAFAADRPLLAVARDLIDRRLDGHAFFG